MKLYIVPTPIGNLEDITLRALKIFQVVDVIFCEDTRTTQNLLKHFQIENKRCYSYHIHNEHQQIKNFVEIMKTVKCAALTSDAGTPGISDPGYLLIKACLSNGIEIECLPGATAFVVALINSGMPSDRFYFHGFLPHKKGKETTLKMLAQRKETVIFYESPHRLLKTLEMMLPIFGSERPIAISRELTKMYEENFRGSIEQTVKHFKDKGVKGEFVVVVGEPEN